MLTTVASKAIPPKNVMWAIGDKGQYLREKKDVKKGESRWSPIGVVVDMQPGTRQLKLGMWGVQKGCGGHTATAYASRQATMES